MSAQYKINSFHKCTTKGGLLMEDKYNAQKKYLAQKKRVSVWMDADKYERFKAAVQQNGDSIYALVNKLADDYLASKEQGTV